MLPVHPRRDDLGSATPPPPPRRPRRHPGRGGRLHVRVREGLLLPLHRPARVRELPRHERAVRRAGSRAATGTPRPVSSATCPTRGSRSGSPRRSTGSGTRRPSPCRTSRNRSRSRPATAVIVQDNCVRCHAALRARRAGVGGAGRAGGRLPALPRRGRPRRRPLKGPLWQRRLLRAPFPSNLREQSARVASRFDASGARYDQWRSPDEVAHLVADRPGLPGRRRPHRAAPVAPHQHLRAQAGGPPALRAARRGDRGHHGPEGVGPELARAVRLVSQDRRCPPRRSTAAGASAPATPAPRSRSSTGTRGSGASLPATPLPSTIATAAATRTRSSIRSRRAA